MIINNNPLSMVETAEYIKKSEVSDGILQFIKKFSRLDIKKAKAVEEKINALELMKVKPEHIIKIIDICPENAEDLNKIFTDVSLDENESNKILEAIKEFK